MDIHPAIAGANVAQWVIAIFSGGTFVAVLRFVIQWRGLTNSAEKVLRDHYASELERLTDKLDEKETHFLSIEKHLRDIIRTADERYEECQSERAQDRQRMAEMQSEIEGLKRQVPIASADRLLIMEGKATERAPEAVAAAKRIKENGRH